MKNIGKLAVLCAVLAASASFAHADTILAASWGNTSGFSPSGLVTTGNTAMTFNGSITYSSVAAMLTAYPTGTTPLPTNAGFTGSTAAFDLNGGTAWATPGTGSAYVGSTVTSEPGGLDVPYGFYKYTTTFLTNVTGTLNVLADDSTAVFLGSSTTPIIAIGALGADGQCAQNQPNCVLADSIGFSATTGQTLTFIVMQAGVTGQVPNQDPSGVDFNVSATPEPSSLMLLGTGLISAAGMMFRRRATV